MEHAGADRGSKTGLRGDAASIMTRGMGIADRNAAGNTSKKPLIPLIAGAAASRIMDGGRADRTFSPTRSVLRAAAAAGLSIRTAEQRHSLAG